MRGSKELEIILNHDTSDRLPMMRERAPGERMQLARLKLAIQFRQKKVSAFIRRHHKYDSVRRTRQLSTTARLNMVRRPAGLPPAASRFQGAYLGEHKQLTPKGLQVLLILTVFVSFPLLSIIYILVPKSRFAKFIRKPFIKFLCHSASYCFFLCALIGARTHIGTPKCCSSANIGQSTH